jgi:drug/metabolite transporter (DMT)-like permease
MKFIKAILIWFLIVPLAILNGGLRESIIEPYLGSSIALPLSGIILSVLIFLISYLLIPKIGKHKINFYILIGIIWFILTNLFDLLMNVVENRPMSDFIIMYDITTGNLWCIVVAVCLTSPILVAKIRKLIIK